MWLLPILIDQLVFYEAIEGMDIGFRIQGYQLVELLTYGLYITFDLRFVFWLCHPAWIQETAVELCHLLVSAIELGII